VHTNDIRFLLWANAKLKAVISPMNADFSSFFSFASIKSLSCMHLVA